MWNLCKGAGGQSFEQDFRHIAANADIILAQEALMSQRSLATFHTPGFELVHAAAYRRNDGLRDGVMTACRVKARHQQRIICKYPEPVFKTPKSAMVTRYPLSGGHESLMVINVHATLIRSIKGATKELHHLMQQVPAHSGPLILAGDFNTLTPRYLDTVCQVLDHYRLTHNPISEDPRGRLTSLDHVFTRRLVTKNAKVRHDISSSDHYPLLFHFEVEG